MLGVIFIVSVIIGIILLHLYHKYEPSLDIIKDEVTQHKMLILWYNDYNEENDYIRTFYVITEL